MPSPSAHCKQEVPASPMLSPAFPEPSQAAETPSPGLEGSPDLQPHTFGLLSG